MKPASNIDNEYDVGHLQIEFDNIPDFDEHDIIISDLIHWQPLCDVYVAKNEVVVTVEIAGVALKDFSIYAHKKYMIVDGIRRSPDAFANESCTFHTIEIPYGRFNRRIDFPVPVLPRQYQYRIDNGILRLGFPIIKERIIPIEDG
jgi:HSP20 family molecular chaperone IbpA